MTLTLPQVIGPADRTGIVGIKPTPGLTSCEGVIPESRNFDTVGTFGRTVSDAVSALDAICDADLRLSSHVSGREVLKGATFGAPWSRVWERVASHEGAHVILTSLLATIEDNGARIIRPSEIPSLKELVPEDGHWDWYA